MIKVDNLANSNQEMQAGLTELTGQELSEMNGGFAASIISETGNPVLAAFAGNLVFGQRVSLPLLIEQARIGVPPQSISRGSSLANSVGGGVYTGPVTAAKLG